jgi:tetratricopeptide (TPR) repeat protein
MARSLTFAALFLMALSPPLAADVIHLTNGGSIEADSWEESGKDLIIRQDGATIVIPRAEVSRIEATPRRQDPAKRERQEETATGERPAHPSPAGETPQTSDAAASPSPPAPSREEVLERISELKRRLRDYPTTRAENTLQLIALYNYLGEKSYMSRDYDDALAQFKAALDLDRDDGRAQLGQAATYFATGQDLYARSILERAQVAHPDDPRLLTLLGDVYNSQERPEDALEVWEKAQSVRPDDSITRRIETLRRQHAVDRSYSRSDAAHFTLKYDGERAGPDLEAEILDYLEDRFPGLVTRFDYYPTQPIIVIVYPARQFYQATLAKENVAGLFDGKIRVPSGGLQSLNDEARKVLLHELAHAFIAGKSRRTAPRWLHEGIAQMIEGKSSSPPVRADLAAEFGATVPPESWGHAFSYPSALSFVEYLEQREGFFRLVEVLEVMATGIGVEEAFLDVTRYTLQELRQAWGESLPQETGR